MTAAVSLTLLTLISGGDELYQWPLDPPCALTSSFGEYRPGRLHVGIDLRTGGIGKDVHAAADGYVARIRCSPTGYGKAVYLRLHDGNTAVYAHLDAFAEPLAAYVRRAQHKQCSYTVDLHPKPRAFAVERGQIIGKSGQTGTAAPHLHYELRDTAGHPINPRLLGVTWPDTTRPIIQKVLIVPADPDSTLNGDIMPVVAPARQTATGEYACDPVRASGRIGLGVDVIDPANHSDNRLGIHLLRTLEADRELFRVQHDKLPYETTRDGAVAYHPFLPDQGRFLLQWRWPGNRSESFQHASSEGWYEVPDEPVTLRVHAEDFCGNRATLTIPLVPDRPAPLAPPASAQAEGGTVRLDCFGEWLVLTAAFTGPESDPPVLHIDGPPPQAGGAFRRVDDTVFRACYLPGERAEQVTLRVVHDRLPLYEQEVAVCRRGAKDRTFAMGDVAIHVSGASPYGTLFIMEEPLPALPVASKLPVLGRPYRIWPEHTPIDTPVELSFPMPAGAGRPGRVHMYRATKSGWTFVPTSRKRRTLRIATRDLGIFTAMEDNKPPVISDIVAGWSKDDTNPGRPIIRATVTDQGSGIAEVTVTCDKQWLLMEYDPERKRIEWERDEDLPPGPHNLTFRATDKAGNVTTVKRPLTCQR